MQFWDAFINVLAIVAIIGVGAFIMVFIGDLLLNVIDNRNGIFFKNKDNKSNEKTLLNENDFKNKYISELENETPVLLEDKKPDVKISSSEKYNSDKALIEERELNKKMGMDKKSTAVIDEEPDFFADNVGQKELSVREIMNSIDRIKDDVLLETEIPVVKSVSKTGKTIDDYSRELDEFIQTNSFGSKKEEEDDEEEEDEEIEDDIIVKPIKNVTKNSEDNIVVAKPKEEVKEIVEEKIVEDKKDEEKEKLIAEYNRLKEETEKAKSEIEYLKKALEESKNAANNTTEIAHKNLLGEEVYIERIAILEARLKETKKQYRLNSKEFKPLEKVRKTLEKDKAKLRRKEAIVAKQKVELYGVNNFVDINQEKAKILSNDLELLDGLRLSVNHCEEVMNVNKERYPILEKTDTILKADIANIEKDLAQARADLASVRKGKN